MSATRLPSAAKAVAVTRPIPRLAPARRTARPSRPRFMSPVSVRGSPGFRAPGQRAPTVRRQVHDLLDLRFGISETPDPDVLQRVVARQDPYSHLELARIGGGTPRLPDAAVARRQKLLHVGDPLVQARVAAEEEDLHLAVVAAIVLENLEDARTLPRVLARRHRPLQADLVRLPP